MMDVCRRDPLRFLEVLARQGEPTRLGPGNGTPAGINGPSNENGRDAKDGNHGLDHRASHEQDDKAVTS